jgi:hypothetical protein
VSRSEAKRAAVERTTRGARYGSGTLIRRAGLKGDTWIAKWRDGGRQVQRGLGFVHSKKDPDGLTRAEAEAALSKLREQVAIERAEERDAEANRAADERRRPLATVGEALIAAKRAAGRKPSTIEAYSYWLRIHIIDFFGPMPVGAITREDVRGFAAALERKGLAPKSRANALGTLHSLIIEFAIGEGWSTGENQIAQVRGSRWRAAADYCFQRPCLQPNRVAASDLEVAAARAKENGHQRDKDAPRESNQKCGRRDDLPHLRRDHRHRQSANPVEEDPELRSITETDVIPPLARK